MLYNLDMWDSISSCCRKRKKRWCLNLTDFLATELSCLIFSDIRKFSLLYVVVIVRVAFVSGISF